MATKRAPLLNLLWISIRWMCLLLAVSLLGFAADWDVTKAYLHPQLGAMGGTGIAGFNIPYACILNPALLGGETKWNLSYYQATLEQELTNQHIQYMVPFGGMTHSFSYYRQGLNGIPITQYIDQRIRQNGSFSAGITQLRWSAGISWDDLLWMHRLGLGASAGLQQYDFTPASSMFYQVGLYTRPSAYDFLGLGVVLDMTGGQNTFRAGISSHIAPLDLSTDWDGVGVRLGGQYAFNEILKFRGGLESRFLTLGTGLDYDQLVGILPQNVAFSIDLATQIPLDPAYSASTFTSLTIQEQDHLRVPTIEDYPRVTNKNEATIQGWSEPASTVWLQVNEQDRIQTHSNENGQWSTAIPLSKGSNKVTAWAADSRKERPSEAGKTIYIIRDDSLPIITLKAWVFETGVSFNIESTKILVDSPLIRTDKISARPIAQLEGQYNGWINRDEIEHEWIVGARDLANNNAELIVNEPLLNLLFPKTRISITSEEKFLLNGNAYRFSELTLYNDTTGDRSPVKLQKIGQFQKMSPLVVGKNRFRLVDIRDQAEITYPFTIIRTHEYKDAKDDELNKLATLGILDPTPLLTPTSPLTQSTALLWLARLRRIKIPNADIASPAWRKGLEQKAFKEHWIETSDDDTRMSRKDAMIMMAKVLGLNIFEPLTDATHVRNVGPGDPDAKLVTWFVEHGMIPAGTINLNETIGRGEFAKWLSRTDIAAYRIKEFFETN